MATSPLTISLHLYMQPSTLYFTISLTSSHLQLTLHNLLPMVYIMLAGGHFFLPSTIILSHISSRMSYLTHLHYLVPGTTFPHSFPSYPSPKSNMVTYPLVSHDLNGNRQHHMQSSPSFITPTPYQCPIFHLSLLHQMHLCDLLI